MRLEGKTAVVTGATSGLGRAIAEAFVEEGAYVYAVGRRPALLDTLVAELSGRCTPVVADVTDMAALDRLYDTVRREGRRIDVVVANAGGTVLTPLDEVTPESLRSEWALNVGGTFFTVQKALPLLNDGGAVILVSSTAADKGSPGVGLYAASKAAVRSFGRTWASELSGRGIRVNTISPSAVLTEALDGAMRDHRRMPGGAELDACAAAELTQRAYDGYVARIPIGRLGEPAEVARLALFLASDDSSFMTGTNTYIDGGLTQV